MPQDQIEYTNYIHGIFEEVQGAGQLGLPKCHEIRDTLKRAIDVFPRKHHRFLRSIEKHAFDLENAVSELNTPGVLPAGKNPARSKVAGKKRKELEWFAKNADNTHKLVTRNWSDFRSWVMNLLIAIIMFVLGALATYYFGPSIDSECMASPERSHGEET